MTTKIKKKRRLKTMRFKRKGFSSKFITVFCFVMVLGFAQTALAKKCQLDGHTYLGFADPFGQFIATFHSGPKSDEGNIDMQFITADWTVFGTFPTAVSGTHPKGVWKRTGSRSFEWSWIAYAYDASGALVYILKPSGTVNFALRCKNAVITANMSLYAPDQDPLGEDPPAFGCVPYPGPITMRLYELGKITCD
jgi:hypothetical protein